MKQTQLALYIVWISVVFTACISFEEDQARQRQVAKDIWLRDSQRVEVWLEALRTKADTSRSDSPVAQIFIPPTFPKLTRQLSSSVADTSQADSSASPVDSTRLPQ